MLQQVSDVQVLLEVRFQEIQGSQIFIAQSCSVLQCVAMCCSVLQCVARLSDVQVLLETYLRYRAREYASPCDAVCCNTYVVMRCSHSVMRRSRWRYTWETGLTNIQHTVLFARPISQEYLQQDLHITESRNTLQHTATHCNTLQHCAMNIREPCIS